MRIPGIPNRFLKDNIYLLFISLLLLFVSILTGKSPSAEKLTKKYTQELQSYIKESETEFEALIQNQSAINKLVNKQEDPYLTEKISTNQNLFIYKNIKGFTELKFWSTQNIIPDDETVKHKENNYFKKLVNGYFFIQKKSVNDLIIISLTAIKWQYSFESKYLENKFCVNPLLGSNF